MPTYIVCASQSALDDEKRHRIANAITDAHSEEMVGPRYLAQVIYHELPAHRVYVGGELATDQQIWIQGFVRAGRSDMQRLALIKRIASEISKILEIDPIDVWVYINPVVAEDMIEFGHVLPRPYGEREWFRALPPRLQDRLRRSETSDKYM